jgi:DNA polymerase-1
MQTNPYTHALIDGDVLLYQVARGCETDADFGDMHVLWSDFDEAIKVFAIRVQEIEDTLGTSQTTLAFSSARNWRKDVMPSYKAHRKDVRKPLCFNRLKEWASTQYVCEVWGRLEADDTLGLLQNPQTIIVSIDKDLGTVPGWFGHIRMSGEIEVEEITEDQARYRHMVQAFMGDRVDGYPGCNGVGLKTAEKILDKIVKDPGYMEETEWLNCWRSVVSHYEKQGHSVEDAQENFMVAKILTNIGEYQQDKIHITFPTGVTFTV